MFVPKNVPLAIVIGTATAKKTQNLSPSGPNEPVMERIPASKDTGTNKDTIRLMRPRLCAWSLEDCDSRSDVSCICEAAVSS